MKILVGTGETLGHDVIGRVARYRYRVFVEKLGWPLQCRHGEEVDQFDRPDTRYVVAFGESGAIEGVARLLPTELPYLLGELFQQLMGGGSAPNSAQVWELSRFAAVDWTEPSSDALGQFSSRAAVHLLHASLALASRAGVKRLITVSPVGVERLLRKAGFAASRAAQPVMVGGQLLFACWIEVPVLQAGRSGLVRPA